MSQQKAQFVQRLANTFLGLSTVSVATGNRNIAYCHVPKKKIWFDFDRLFSETDDPEVLFSEMMRFKGLAFHEMHHLKHTFHFKHAKTQSASVLRVAGWLEDGRIETMAVLKFDKLADYFNFAVNYYIIKSCKPNQLDKNNVVFTYILMYGRKLFLENMDFLKKMRKLMIAFCGKDITLKIEDIVDKFHYEKKCSKRIELGRELADILYNENIDRYKNNSHMFGSNSKIFVNAGDRKTMSQALRELGRDFKKAKQVNKLIVLQLRQDDAQIKDDSEKKKKFKQEKAKKMKELKDKIDKKEEEVDEAWDKLYDSDDQKERDKLRQKIREAKKEKQEAIKERENAREKQYQADEEQIQQIISAGTEHAELNELIEDLKDLNQEIIGKHQQDLVGDLKSIGKAMENVFSDNTFQVTNDMKQVAKDLDKGLRKLKSELVKGYVAGHKTGRVNVRRYINRKSRADTKVFNKFIPDRVKETKLLVNIYIDSSGSMRGNWERAINSLWIINEAMNKDKNKVMCYLFNDSYLRFKDYDGMLTIPAFTSGGTDPRGAINDSIPVIEKYRKKHGFKHVIDIFITDGQFSNSNECKKLIEKLGRMGHETILINVWGSRDKRGAKHFTYIKSFDELGKNLVRIMGKIKKNIIKQVR